MAEEKNFDITLLGYSGSKGELIPLLQAAQNHYGYIPRTAIEAIAAFTKISPAAVYGVITFYNQFRLRPMGKYVIQLCDGTACHVSNARMLIDAVRDELGIENCDTTEDGLFTLATVACLGCCSLAPVMMINGETHGRLTPASVRKILRGIRRQGSTRATEVPA